MAINSPDSNMMNRITNWTRRTLRRSPRTENNSNELRDRGNESQGSLSDRIDSWWYNNGVRHRVLHITQERKCPYCYERIINDSRTIDKFGNIDYFCPHCTNDLPPDFFSHNSKVIALIGGAEAAKTTYLTVLTEQLLTDQPIWKTLNIQAYIVGKAAIQRHQDNRDRLYFYKEMLIKTERIELAKTVIRLTHRQGNRTKTIFLSFSDTAGEEFDDVRNILRNKDHQNIGNADAIIFLFDPLHIRKFRHELTQMLRRLSQKNTQKNNQQKDRLELLDLEDDNRPEIDYENNIHEVFSHKKRLKSGKVTIPLAFCLSKADLLQDVSTVYLSEELDSEILALRDILEEIKYTSMEMREWLEDFNSKMVRNIDTKFTDALFFPVSPLGKIPRNYRIDDPGPEPKGTLHPLIWILNELKFIKI